MSSKPIESLLDFILRERILAITVVCSIITFQFISVFKINIVDPFLELLFPDYVFDYLNITIREGIEQQKIDQKKLVIDFGQIFKAFISWFFMIGILYIIYKYTRVQDIHSGNPGVAIM
jgi:large-conductance mechanosensitive channel